MAGGELPAERLGAYLRELRPETRAMLLTALERAEMRGEAVAGSELILQELRAGFRNGSHQPAPHVSRLGNATRQLFMPLEAFLIDDVEDRVRLGRVPRVCLDPIWQWIARDLLPADTEAYVRELDRVLADPKEAARVIRAFQDLIVQRAGEYLARIANDDRAERKLAGQLGVPRALEHLREVLKLLKARDAIAVLGSRLPNKIPDLAEEDLFKVEALLGSPIARHPDIFVYALVLTMVRLAMPWQLVRVVVKAADSDLATRIAETPYAAAVTLVLDELRQLADKLRSDLKGGQIAAAGLLVRDIHDAVRLLRTELDFSGDTAWGRDLAALRVRVSDVIKAEIATIPARVRVLLRPRPSSEILPGETLEDKRVSEIEALIGFAGICRNYASELAINEVTLRTQKELQSYLDSGTSALLDALRNASDADRNFRQSQLDAAVRFAGKAFGPHYASLLTRAAEVARHSERKAAKA